MAGTRFAVQKIPAAMSRAAETARLDNARVSLVEHAGAEGMGWDMQEPEESLGAHTDLHLLNLDNGLMAVKDVVTGAQTYSRTAMDTKIRVKSIWAELDQAQYTEHDI